MSNTSRSAAEALQPHGNGSIVPGQTKNASFAAAVKSLHKSTVLELFALFMLLRPYLFLHVVNVQVAKKVSIYF